MTFELLRIPMALMPEVARDDNGSPVFRERYGVLVVCRDGRTFFRYPDVNVMIVNVTSILVFLAIPMRVVAFFAVNFLGHLSTIYKRVLYEEFSISKSCG